MKRNTKFLLTGAALAGLIGLATVGVSHAGGDWHGKYGSYGGHHGGYGMGHGGGHGPMHGRDMFNRFDQNGDGKVTQEEFDAQHKSMFAKFDGDGSGTMALEEFQALWLEHMHSRMVDLFQALDEDGDGQVTPAEFNDPMSRMFLYLDRDEDGSVTKEELKRRHHRGERYHRYHRDDDDDREEYEKDDD